MLRDRSSNENQASDGARKRLKKGKIEGYVARTNAPQHSSVAPSSGSEAVDWRVKVWWPKMKKWYAAHVVAYDARACVHTVRYRCDGVEQDLRLLGADAETLRWVSPSGQEHLSVGKHPLPTSKAKKPPQTASKKAAQERGRPKVLANSGLMAPWATYGILAHSLTGTGEKRAG